MTQRKSCTHSVAAASPATQGWMATAAPGSQVVGKARWQGHQGATESCWLPGASSPCIASAPACCCLLERPPPRQPPGPPRTHTVTANMELWIKQSLPQCSKNSSVPRDVRLSGETLLVPLLGFPKSQAKWLLAPRQCSHTEATCHTLCSAPQRPSHVVTSTLQGGHAVPPTVCLSANRCHITQ